MLKRYCLLSVCLLWGCATVETAPNIKLQSALLNSHYKHQDISAFADKMGFPTHSGSVGDKRYFEWFNDNSSAREFWIGLSGFFITANAKRVTREYCRLTVEVDSQDKIRLIKMRGFNLKCYYSVSKQVYKQYRDILLEKCNSDENEREELKQLTCKSVVKRDKNCRKEIHNYFADNSYNITELCMLKLQNCKDKQKELSCEKILKNLGWLDMY